MAKKLFSKKKKVLFLLNAPDAKEVLLTGDFNSWKEAGLKMEKGNNGEWSTEVNLEPGRYEYKFIVDGQWWTDPLNTSTVTNSVGSLNSLKEVIS
ncbi:MAG: glycogen-binding domain-containing protein [bacterium]|nr:glycogen-binding domain-containing protein [bacterium]